MVHRLQLAGRFRLLARSDIEGKVAARGGNARRRFGTLVIAFCLALLAASPRSAAGSFGTPEEAKAMAEKAAELVRAEGLSPAWAPLSDPVGEFRDRDLYVFVLDLRGFLLVHPNPAAVGSNGRLTQDPDGKFFVAEMIARAQAGEEAFWVTYRWPHPATGEVGVKRTWIVRVGRWLIGCGAYIGEAL